MEHTKGTWEIRPKLANGDRHFNIIVNQPAVCICQTNVPGMKGLHPLSPAEIKANARLIVAAPDLLKATKTLLIMLDNRHTEDDEECPVYNEVVELVEQAIAKAMS